MSFSQIPERVAIPLKVSRQSSLSKKIRPVDSFKKEINQLSFLKRYFEAIKRGNFEDTEFIESSLVNDPMRFKYDCKHQLRRANIINFDGEFPLYVAAKYNNLRVLHILHDRKFLS